MATTDNPLADYGYDQNTGQQLAQSLGITTQQLAAALATTPATGGSAPQTSSYGMTTGGQLPGRDISSTIQQLQAAKAAGMGGSSAGQSGQSQSTLPTGAVDYSGARAAENLGAQALGAAGFSGAQGAFPVYNPVPGQINSSKGGVQTNVPSPMVANAIPTGNTPNVASVFGQPDQQSQGLQYWGSQMGGGTADDAAKIEKQNGWASGTIGKQFYQAGVQAGKIQPNATNPAPASGGTPTGVTPANAPGSAPATPWATAPSAPTINTATPSTATSATPDFGAMAAHTAGLENAGKAMYAHFGGDPDSASRTDILNFHTQLHTTLASTPLGQAAQGAATAGIPATGATPQSALGVSPPAAPGGAPGGQGPPVKMARGGWVPGNRDDQRGSWGNQQSGQQQQRQGAPQRQQGQGASQWQPPSNLPSGGNLSGWTPTPPAGGPSPMQPQGMPGNLPGISGGPPAFGSAPGTPPPLTLPPWQGGQGGQGQQGTPGQGGLPPANIMGTTPGGAPPPSPMQFQGMPGNLPGISGGPPAFGSAPMTPPNITPPPWQGTKQMATGGFVPGRGNGDTVPALLTPGEYVIPKQQAAQLFGGRAPIRMAGGGAVPDNQTPEEARRKALTVPGSTSSSAPPTQPSQSSSQSSQQDSSAPSSSGGSDPWHWSNMVQNAQAQQAANMGSGGPGSVDSLGKLGDEDLANQAIQGTGANTAAGAADIASGLVSAVQTAWGAYQKSIKDWQPQAQAFGKGGTPNYQNTTLQQDTTT